MRMTRLLLISLLARQASSFVPATTTTTIALRTLSSKQKSIPAAAAISPYSRIRNIVQQKQSVNPNSSTKTTTTDNIKKGPKKIPSRPPLLRADRVLSNRGFGSRSECFETLRARRVAVWKENRWCNIIGPSERIHSDARLMVDGKEVGLIPLLMAYHKPKWVLSVMSDPKDRPNLSHVVPETFLRQKLHPVGRLDYDTSGLLLFSSSGPLTQHLLHPSHDVSKEYVATVEGLVNPAELHSRLETGVETAEGVHTAELGSVQHLTPDDAKAILKNIRENLPKEYNTDDLEERGYLKNDITEMSHITLTVTEGKHRMVRRMLANCGHPVLELKRQRHGGIHLGDLPEGQFRDLTEDELEWAQQVSPQKGRKSKR